MKKNYVFSSVVLLSLAFLTTPTLSAQNIGINATGAAPDAGAMLDISSTNKGLLIPRVNITNLNNIAPITGSATVSMLVYNTNATTGQGYYYWNGATWVRLSTGDAWQLTGNAGTNATTNFLGTTDNIALRIRTNNANRFEFTTNGRFRSFDGGSAAAPTYSWTGDANTGVYNPGADVLAFSTGGVDRMRIGDYNGSIGIGRTAQQGFLGAGPIVDIFQPLEVGNDVGSGEQATIGYWVGSDVVIQPETNMYGYLGTYANPNYQAWWELNVFNAYVISNRQSKRNITQINTNQDIEKLVMADIEKIQPSFYDYEGSYETPRAANDNRYRPQFILGVITDESPDYILGQTFDKVNTYSLATLALAGVKYNYKAIKKISTQINDFGSVSENKNKVVVSYGEEFKQQLKGVIPVVNITPIGAGQNLVIIEKNSNGFTVINETDGNASFDWIAVAKVNSEDNNIENNIDKKILDRIHLTEEKKQEVINHYSNIKITKEYQAIE